MSLKKILNDIDLETVRIELAKRKLSYFSQYFWNEIDPDPFIPTWSFDCMAEHLQAVFDGELSNLVINIPPGFAKSIECSVMFPAWGWANDMSKSFLCSTRENGNLKRDAFKFYNLVSSKKFTQAFGNPFERQTKKKISEDYKDIQNNQKGFRRALTTGASTTGARGKIIILDDPNDRSDAFSEKKRNSINDYVFNTLSTRNFAKRGGSMIIVMQRLHEKDVAGEAIERGFPHLKLPMEADGNSKFALGSFSDPRKEGEFLNPELFDEKSKEDTLSKLSELEYVGQYQQSPVAKTGNLFKQKFMENTYDEDEQFTKLHEMYQFWDTTFKEDGTSYVVGQCWQKKGNEFFLRDQVRGKWGFSRTADEMLSFYNKWPECYYCYVENKANGEALVDYYKKGDGYTKHNANPIPGLMLYKQDSRTKYERADSVIKYWETGNVRLPEDATWKASFIDEHLSFPLAANDDQVDVSTMALIKLNERQKSVFSAGDPLGD